MAKTTWIIELEEDPITGELFLPLPDKLLKELKWDENTELTWDINETGEISIKKTQQ